VEQRSFSFNSALNLFSQVFIALVALVCLPTIIDHMGAEAFGLLALLWTIIGYFGILDFGVGQSSVKFLAESVARGERSETLRLARGVLIMSFVLGLLGCLLAAVLSFSGVEGLLNVSPSRGAEARWSFRLLAVCLPAVFAQGPLRSILLANNRFDKVNVLAALQGGLQWGGSAAVLLLGGDLLSVVAWTVVTRYIVAASYLVWGARQLPGLLSGGWKIDFAPLSEFIRFSGWMTVTQVLTPFIPLAERSLLAAAAGLAAVTYFSVPADAIVRLWLIPASLASTLLPVLSGKWIDEQTRAEGVSLYRRSVKHVLAIMIPIVFLLVTYRSELMTLWMGSDFAGQTATIVGVLGVGILFNSLAALPQASLLAVGRPDVAAKLLMVELPVYLVICYYAVSEYGAVGIACAWFLRVFAEYLIQSLAVRKSFSGIRTAGPLPFAVKIWSLGLACFAILQVLKPYGYDIATALLVSSLYALLMWKFIYDPIDQKAIAGIFLSIVRAKPAAVDKPRS
jgi:O-antigen/teichoic acid export membrane protein